MMKVPLARFRSRLVGSQTDPSPHRMGRGNHPHNGQKVIICRVRKNERKNRATTMMTKAQALIERGAIRQEQNAIDAILPVVDAIDAFPLGRNVSGETRPVRNAVGAIELEPNGPVLD
jgi:hypothetical protein